MILSPDCFCVRRETLARVDDPTGVAGTLRRHAVLRNTVRAILGLLFAAAATWLANYLTDMIFGPENGETRT